MASYDYYMCDHCQKIAAENKQGACTECGEKPFSKQEPYTRFTKELCAKEHPLTAKPETAPNIGTTAKKGMSKAERDRAVKAMLGFFGFALLALVVGLVCLGVGLGGGYRSNTMKLFGFLGLCACPILIVIGVVGFFRASLSKTQAKTPEAAFRNYWEKTVFQKKTFSDKFEDPSVAVGYALRTLPEAARMQVSQRALLDYIEGLRERAIIELGRLKVDANAFFGDSVTRFNNSTMTLQIENLTETTLDEASHSIAADVLLIHNAYYTVSGTYENSTFNCKLAALRLHLCATLLKDGESWYVADLMPNVKM